MPALLPFQRHWRCQVETARVNTSVQSRGHTSAFCGYFQSVTSSCSSLFLLSAWRSTQQPTATCQIKLDSSHFSRKHRSFWSKRSHWCLLRVDPYYWKCFDNVLMNKHLFITHLHIFTKSIISLWSVRRIESIKARGKMGLEDSQNELSVSHH